MQSYQSYINIAIMFDDDGKNEIKEGGQNLGWREVVKRYEVKNKLQLDAYNRAGYPTVIKSLEDAAELGVKFGLEEQKTRQYNQKATRSDFIFFPGIIEEGMEVDLVEIPITELSGIGTMPLRRDSKVPEILKNASDLTKLPPCVVTINPQTGKWESLDGRSRIKIARELGVQSLIAYYVPKEYFYSRIIRKH